MNNVCVKFLLNFRFTTLMLLCLISLKSIGQGFDPCGPDGPGCSSGPSVSVFSPNDTFNMSQPAQFIVGSMDINQLVDTTFFQSVTMTVVSGPGSVTAPLTSNFNKGIAMFPGVTVTVPGNYSFEFASAGLVSYTSIKLFDTISNGGGGHGGPNCFGAGPTVAMLFMNMPGNLNVNAPFNIQVATVNGSGCFDTTFSNSVTLSKLNGPGNIVGNLSSFANHGNAIFNNLQFDQPGNYQLLASSTGFASDTSFMINVNSGGGGGSGCPPTSSSGTRTNMGLYGGSSLDLSWNYTNKRLFAAISSPASLFYTDDTCKTWHRAFPDDSLEYGCGRGWGGRAMRVLSNMNNWIAVQTSQEAGTLNALVISYDGGTSWTTAMDGYMMNHAGMNSQNVTGMGLSDYYMYCLMGKYVIRIHDGAPITGSDILNITTELSGINTNSTVKSIAVANSSSGYPIYMVVDTTGQMFGSTGTVYKKTSSGAAPVRVLFASSSISSVFTHPGQVTGDTVFAVAQTMGGSTLYRSLDGGTNWSIVTTPPGNFMMSDVDYSPDWISSMPLSNGLALIIPGAAASYDLGDTWTAISLQNNGGAIHPNDISMVVGTRGRGVVVSTSGIAGPYEYVNNYGLEAVMIKKIARTPSKGIFYLATRPGLAYTTGYSDAADAVFDKWNSPYGQFPITAVGDDAGVSAVAIDQSDSLHVIAGYSNGFSKTTTGVSGFSNINPIGWNSTNGDPAVNDILFVNSSIALAVTGGDNNGASGKGNIWRTTDGGSTWSIVSPVGFSCGNSIAKGTLGALTVIYIGTGLSGSMSDPGKLWKSTDDGSTWTQVNFGPTATNNPGINNLPIYDVAVDPRGTDTLYLACGSNTDYAFVKSFDGGASYITINANGEGAFTSVCINQTYPDSVYTAIRRDILVYDATTDSVMYIYRGLPGELVPDLAFGSVLAGTSMGFFRVSAEPIVITAIEGVSTRSLANDLVVYPNPVHDEAVLYFTTEKTTKIDILVYDLLGHEVIHKIISNREKGEQKVKLETGNLPAGTYYVRVNKDNGRVSKVFVRIN